MMAVLNPATACGMPVMASRIEVPPQPVRDDECGLLFERRALLREAGAR
jgi:hypothetical protein